MALPMTQAVMRYYEDMAAAIRGEWAQGNLWNREVKRLVTDLDDFRTMDFTSIAAFYADIEEGEKRDMTAILEQNYDINVEAIETADEADDDTGY